MIDRDTINSRLTGQPTHTRKVFQIFSKSLARALGYTARYLFVIKTSS